MTPIVDFHNHYYPPAYLAELEGGGTAARLEREGDGRLLLHYPGDYNVIVEGHRSLDERIRVMDREGVDVQVLTLTTPGVHVEEPDRGIELARLVNDGFAAAVERYPDRFAPLAALPLQAPDASVEELERAVGSLGLRGVLLFSNIEGRTLDEEDYEPLFRRLHELEVPAFIHPTSPAVVGPVEAYRLTAILGFLFDTSVAVARLIFAGIPERYPDLRLVVGHLGGTLPWVAERMDRGFEAYDECRARLARPPSEHLKRMYFDTVNFHPDALRMGLAFAGSDQLVLGTDYPHEVGDVRRALDAVGSLPLGESEKAAVLGGNAVELLGLE